MALMLGQLYDALRAGNVPDDKARAAAEEVANHEGELSKLRTELSERIGRVEVDARLLKCVRGPPLRSSSTVTYQDRRPCSSP
jgi:hypothetical protein